MYFCTTSALILYSPVCHTRYGLVYGCEKITAFLDRPVGLFRRGGGVERSGDPCGRLSGGTDMPVDPPDNRFS